MLITHLLFVDDVIIFGIGTIQEWGAYIEVLDLFCSTTGMTVSMEKSSFLYHNVDEETRMENLSDSPIQHGSYQLRV